MKKYNAFTVAEISIVFGLIILTALLVIPNLIEDNKKFDIISKWKHSYQNVEYVISALKAQVTDTDRIAFKNAKNKEEKEMLLYEILKPYFRIETSVDTKNYKIHYLNGNLVKENDEYYIEKYYKTSLGKILGIKWLQDNEKYIKELPIALISVDLNGINKPNKWGYDVFGIYIFEDKIEPLGKTQDDFFVKSDCSKKGTGISCSYYYHIYGGQLK